MFVLNSDISIGPYSFKGGVHEVRIRKSVNVIMDTASIMLPAISKVNDKNSNLTGSTIKSAELFSEGMPVEIKLGYNGNYRTEFKGFVRRVNIGTPLELELEGYAFKLRFGYPITKGYKTITLPHLLNFICAGTGVYVHPDVPNITLNNLSLDNCSALEVLEYLQKKLHLAVYFIEDTLYAGLEQVVIRGKVKYQLGWNVIRDGNLRYRQPSDNRVLVRVIRKYKTGQALLYEVGDKGGSLVELKVNNIDDKQDLKLLADNTLAKAKRVGYEGKLNCFLEPYCDFGYSATVTDPTYGERDGNYFVNAIEVVYNTRGARRMVEIKQRLD